MRLSVPLVRCAIVVIYVAIPVLCVPLYLTSEVVEYSESDREYCGFDNDSNISAFTIVYSPLAQQTGLLQFNLYFFSIACKLVPCLIVVGANLLAVQQIKRFQVQRRCTVFSRINSYVGHYIPNSFYIHSTDTFKNTVKVKK